MGNVVVEMTANDRDLFLKLSRLAGKVGSLEEAMRRVSRASTDTKGKLTQVKTQADQAFDVGKLKSFAQQLGLVATGAGAVVAAMKLIGNEITNTRERQANAAKTQIDFVTEMNDVILNMQTKSDEEVERVLARIPEVSKKANIPQAYVARALKDAISASGGHTGRALVAVEAGGLLFPHKPEQFQRHVGAMLDLQKVTRSDDPMVNIGLMGATGALSRVVEPDKQAKTIPMALLNLTQFGATYTQAGSAFAALSSAAAEESGEMTSTAAINMAKRLNEFLSVPREAYTEGALSEPEKLKMEKMAPRIERIKKKKDLDHRLSDRELSMWQEYLSYQDRQEGAVFYPAIPAGLDTFDKQLRYIQEHPELYEELMRGMDVRAKLKGPVQQMIKGSGPAAEFYEQFQLEIPQTAEGLAAKGRKTVERIQNNPYAQQLRLKRAMETTTSDIELANVGGAMGGLLREGLNEVFKASGMSHFEQRVNRVLFETGGGLRADALPQAINLVAQRRKDLQPRPDSRADPYYGQRALQYSMPRPAHEPTEQERNTIESLKNLEQILTDIYEQAKAQTEETKKTNQATTRPTLAHPDEDR